MYFVALNLLILWVKQSEDCNYVNGLLTSVLGEFFFQTSYKFKFICTSPLKNIILLLSSELCGWWAPSNSWCFILLLSSRCTLPVFLQVQISCFKKKNYVGHPGLIKLEFLNIFVVVFLLLLYKLLEGKRNYDDFLSHVHFRLYFERVKQEMSTYD